MLNEKLGSAKNINIKNVLSIIRKSGPISKVELSNILNTSKTAMSFYVNYLLEKGLLCKVGKGESKESGGKKPVLIDLNSGYKYLFGVIIGVDTIKIALADFKGKILEKLEFSTDQEYGHVFIIDKIINQIENIIKKDEIKKDKILGIGIGVPGVVNRREVIVISPNLIGWNNIKIKNIFETRLGIKTIVDNESRVQSIGEKYFGIAGKSENFISVEAGAGICGGIFLRNQLINGFNSKAGEIGHITLLRNGPKCHCGNNGCWEALISISSLIKNINTKLGSDFSINEIAEIYNEGTNDVVNEYMEEMTYWFGVGFSILLNIIDVDLIILHGQYSKFGQRFLEKVKNNISSHVFPKMKLNKFNIYFSNLGEDAELFGAFSMILDEIFSVSLKNVRDKLIF